MNVKINLYILLFLCVINSAGAEYVITVREAPELIPFITDYNETTPKTLAHFLNYLEPYSYGGACSMRARYIRIKAETVNLSIKETTIRDWDKQRIKKTVCCGHRVNTFEYKNKKYYTTNLWIGDNRIVEYKELMEILYNSF